MRTRPLNAAARAKLKRDFEAIPERMRKVARDQVEATAAAMVREMQAAVDIDQGDLRRSIRAEDVSTESWIKVRVKAGGPLTTKPVRESAKGNAPTYDYALAYEYGTSRQAPQPFFYPTTRRLRKKHRAVMSRRLAKAARGDAAS